MLACGEVPWFKVLCPGTMGIKPKVRLYSHHSRAKDLNPHHLLVGKRPLFILILNLLYFTAVLNYLILCYYNIT